MKPKRKPRTKTKRTYGDCALAWHLAGFRPNLNIPEGRAFRRRLEELLPDLIRCPSAQEDAADHVA